MYVVSAVAGRFYDFHYFISLLCHLESVTPNCHNDSCTGLHVNVSSILISCSTILSPQYILNLE